MHSALRAIDTKGDGTLSRDEIIGMLKSHNLLKHTDYYTGAVIGEVTMAVADTLVDYVDDDGDGKINYHEFTKVLTAEDILHIPPPKSTNPSVLWGDGR